MRNFYFVAVSFFVVVCVVPDVAFSYKSYYYLAPIDHVASCLLACVHTRSVQRRERPWMLFRDDGSPHVLVTSMQGGSGAGFAEWWTMAQEVAHTNV